MSIEEYDKLIDASDIICGECVKRTILNCNKCPVRATIDYYKSH